MPATVGYQPTLVTEVAEPQERIVSTPMGTSRPSKPFMCRPTTWPTLR